MCCLTAFSRLTNTLINYKADQWFKQLNLSKSYSDVLPLCQGLEKKPKLSPSDKRKLVMMLRNNPGTTNCQACHKLETAGTPPSLFTVKWVCQPRKNHWLQFAAAHMNMTNAFWVKIWWTKKIKSVIVAKWLKRYFWTAKVDAFRAKNTVTTVKHSSGSILFRLFCCQWYWYIAQVDGIIKEED